MDSVKEKYKTERAFRVAIAGRISKLARETNQPHDDLYRRIAMDRFLARLNWDRWMAKGGYVLQRRLPKARRTKDIDLSSIDQRFLLIDADAQRDALLGELQEQASRDIDDYFSFELEFDHMLPGFGKGGIRCKTRCKIDGQLWSSFQIDAVVQDQMVFDLDVVLGDDFLRFAGLEPLSLRVPVKEEVFAEKIHAYTTPRETENTRVKDLMDLALLLEEGVDAEKAKIAIIGVFNIRATHDPPRRLADPPASWSAIFEALAFEATVTLTLEEAFARVREFYSAL